MDSLFFFVLFYTLRVIGLFRSVLNHGFLGLQDFMDS